jgi:hypothetical protein
MGGMGSGRRWHYGARSTTGDYRSLDVRRWAREGMLRPGYWGGWQWTQNGEVVASIQMRAEDDRVILMYRHRSSGGEWKDEQYPVRIVRTPCNLGGARPWFICPALGCGRRAAKLYLGQRYFACRRCYDLAYQSQRENGYGRSLLKAQRIRMRLGGSANMTLPFPPKPKGMRWRTYNRLWAMGNAAAQHSIEGLRIWLDAMKRGR